MRSHALLSASSANRWLMCTPSMRLELTLPEEAESEYAKEGTLAHKLCETKLRKLKGERKRIAKVSDPEMDKYTEMYKDFVEEEWNAMKAETKDAQLLIEQKLEFGDYVPDGFGTSDAVLISDKTLEVIDFKYGKGVPVNAKGNPQLRLYALGAYMRFSLLYDFDMVKTVVFQPRLDSVSSESITPNDLIEWGNDVVKPRAALAFAGEGEYVVGDHCRFCRASAICRARAEAAFEVIDKADTDPALIDDSEIPRILDRIPNAESWIDSIKKYAQAKAIEGQTWEGYKLVEARTQRKIENPVAALEALEIEGYDVEDVTNTKLKGLSDLTKLLGKKKFEEVLGQYIVKPQGDPVLVPESDPRPEFNPIENAFKEETD